MDPRFDRKEGDQMDDTISRQAAIDLLKKLSGGYRWIETETEVVIKDFQELPSAQPKIKCVANVTLTDEQVKEVLEKAKCEILAEQSTDADIKKMQDIEQAMLEKAYECGKQDAARWIPISERLPKPYEYCLWTTTDGRVIYHHCDGLFSNYTAWMPLPEPWKGEEHDVG